MKLLEWFSHAFTYNGTIIVDKPLTAHPIFVCMSYAWICVNVHTYVCCLYTRSCEHVIMKYFKFRGSFECAKFKVGSLLGFFISGDKVRTADILSDISQIKCE